MRILSRTPRSTAIAIGAALLVVGLAPVASSQPGSGTAQVAAQAEAELPTITVAADDAAASETGLDTGSVEFTRDGDLTAEMTVAYSVAGTATSGTDYSALTGSVTFAADKATAPVVVTPIDDTDAEGNETVSITISPSAAYTVGSPSAAEVTIADDDPPAVTVIASDDTASEQGPNTGAFTFSRTGPTTDTLTIAYSMTGTATNGTDYATLSGTVVVAAGSQSAVVTVTPTDDSISEPQETAILTIAASSSYSIGAANSATVKISDNDLPIVSVAATDANASEAGINTGTFTVSRVGDTTGALIVKYAVTGTATSGTDYTALSGSVTIAAGVTSADITVTPIDDVTAEISETVLLTLTADSAYGIGTASATVTITDNEAVTVTVKATDDHATEAGTDTGTFTIYRTGDTTTALPVAYALSGTATNGTDYTTLSGTVVIPAGAGSVTVIVAPIDDTLNEGQEKVILTLAASSSYTIGSLSSGTVEITDNDATIPPAGLMPTSKDQCKKGGWQAFGVFKNQGDCVSWIATGGKNPPNG